LLRHPLLRPQPQFATISLSDRVLVLLARRGETERLLATIVVKIDLNGLPIATTVLNLTENRVHSIDQLLHRTVQNDRDMATTVRNRVEINARTIDRDIVTTALSSDRMTDLVMETTVRDMAMTVHKPVEISDLMTDLATATIGRSRMAMLGLMIGRDLRKTA
jgi:hypothetical protein